MISESLNNKAYPCYMEDRSKYDASCMNSSGLLLSKKDILVLNFIDHFGFKFLNKKENIALYYLLISTFVFSLFLTNSNAQEISKSFELRFVTNDTLANGETDFKGESEYFDTDQRVEYLEKYEKYARKFFNNPQWDKKVISDEEAKRISRKIKAQPLPKVRLRKHLKEWKCIGFKEGLFDERKDALQEWNSLESVSVVNEHLEFISDGEMQLKIPEQKWRSLFKLSVYLPVGSKFRLNLGDAISLGQELIEHGEWTDLSIDIDLQNGRYNLFSNGENIVDFDTMSLVKSITSFTIQASKGVLLDNLHGVQYTKIEFTEDKNSRDIPYGCKTFILEDFRAKPLLKDWQFANYNDDLWQKQTIPFPHGGERFKNESLYMRKFVDVPDFKVAELNVETIDPGGEIWVNGEIVHVQHHRHPVKIDVSKFLEPGRENVLAIRVFPNRVEHTNRHTSGDIYTGAFAGRAWLDFRNDRYIDDLFIYTKSIKDSKAVLQLKAELRNDDWQYEEREMKKTREFLGSIDVSISKWFPAEVGRPIFRKSYPVTIRMYEKKNFEVEIEIENPDLWSFQNPNLYKINCTLIDTAGRKIDDLVATIGIRTISQEGGTFRINGNPEMMNGALLFGYKYPLEDIARTLRCAEEYWLVKEIEMIKRMNGNTIRMSVHHGSKGGINDPRLAEIGDQMGIMFQWTTSTWVRSGSPWMLDFEGLPKYVKQVRNHPSIVMWQVGNHPKYIDFEVDGKDWMTKVYNSIYPLDPSRFIVPVGSQERLGDGIPNDDETKNLRGETLLQSSVWTAPMITRGNFDHITGYGAEWTSLRNYPFPKKFDSDMGWRSVGFRTDYLNSTERAYFDYESEESIGQANWSLRKGKPSYQIKSYELLYDVGSIGRQLGTDEWRTSQAWQGFSAYEAYRKKRWLDYDGLAWCTLHGGGNTATYQKPLIDYYGFSKIAYHSVGMAFQRVLAGSKNVDIVYGPSDRIPICVMNLGDQKSVNLRLFCKNEEGEIIFSKKFEGLNLPVGRSVMDLENVALPKLNEGYYFFEYIVSEVSETLNKTRKN